MITFKNIINDLETFCNSHYQIKSFSWGNTSNITTKDHDFVMVWLVPTSAAISGHMMTLTFQMYVMDLLKQDQSNLLDVLNDTLLIGNDIVSKFWNDEETYDWVINEDNITSEPFDHSFDDYTGGWIFTINLEMENRLSICNLPTE